MYCGDEVSAVVGDIGSNQSKFGFAGEDLPKVVCPSVMGSRVKDDKEVYIGTSSLYASHTHGFSISTPKEKGLVTNWNVVEELWNHAYTELHLNPKEHPLLVAENSFTTLSVKKQYAELMFERFDVPCMFINDDSVLSAFSHGRRNALIVEVGASSTRIVPIYDGYTVRNCSQTSTVGGDKITQYLEHLMTKKEPDLNFRSRYAHLLHQREKLDDKALLARVPVATELFLKERIWEEMKEALCFMPSNALPVVDPNLSKSFHLPDGQIVQVEKERSDAPALLLTPSIWNDIQSKETKGIHELVYDAVQAMDPDIRTEMLNNIILCGGSSLLPGLDARLYAEITALIPSTFKVRMISSMPYEKKFSVFTGGSILASLGTFQQLWISKAEYDEKGSNVVEERCL